jgi:hypothetical protein
MTLLYWCICPYVIYLFIINSDAFSENKFKIVLIHKSL